MEARRSLLERAEYAVLATLLGSMTLIVFTAVVLRYGFNRPVGWTDELAKILFTWLVFLGSALAVRRGIHISIDAFVHFLPPLARRAVAAVGDILILVLFGVLIYYGILISSMTATVTTPSLGVPVALVYLAAPVSALLMLAHHVRHIAATYFSGSRTGVRSGGGEGG